MAGQLALDKLQKQVRRMESAAFTAPSRQPGGAAGIKGGLGFSKDVFPHVHSVKTLSSQNLFG